jgi:hypothetical protein
MIEPRSEGTSPAAFAVVRAAGREPVAPALARFDGFVSFPTAAQAAGPGPGRDRTPGSATASPRRFS